MFTGNGTRIIGNSGGGIFKISRITGDDPEIPTGGDSEAIADDYTIGYVETYDEEAYGFDDDLLLGDINSIKSYCAPGDADVVMTASGDWDDDTKFWSYAADAQRAPQAGENVLIPFGFTCTYNGNDTTEYGWVRVDGTWDFATDQSTKIVLDTFFIDHSGLFRLGSSGSPLADTYTCTIEYADNGDLVVTNDPFKMQRGLVCFGTAEIYGAPKIPYARATAGLAQGATSVTLDAQVMGVTDFYDWKVGDEVLIPGTRLRGFSGGGYGNGGSWENHESEIITIDSIDNTTPSSPIISWVGGLTYPHPACHLDSSKTPHIGNLTRNVKTYTAGSPSNAQHRAHQLFKNKDANAVEYVEAYGMGRTDMDYNTLGTSPVKLGSQTLTSSTNTNGRYTWHFHRNGPDNPALDPTIFRGLVGRDSPGWVFVHHDSHGEMINCIAHDYQAAGFVSEGGGSWGEFNGCWADYSRQSWALMGGTRIKNGGNGIGDLGNGFWNNSRPLHHKNCISTNNQCGLYWTSRVSFGTDVVPGITEEPKAFYGLTFSVKKAFSVIEGFENNEAYACNYGGIVAKKQPSQHHSTRSFMNGFTAWEVENGFHWQYTGMYTMKDFNVTGFDPSHRSDDPTSPGVALSAFRQSINMVFMEPVIENFERGIAFTDDGGENTSTNMDHHIIGPTFTSVTKNYANGSTEVTLPWSNLDNGTNDAVEHTVGSLTSGAAGAIVPVYPEDECTWNGSANFVIAENFTYTDSLGSTTRYHGVPDSTKGIGDRVTGQVDAANAGKTGKDFGIMVIITAGQIEILMQNEGVYTSAAGDKVLLIPDLIQDRTTGNTTYFWTPVAIRCSSNQFYNILPDYDSGTGDNGALGTHDGQNFSSFDPAGTNGLT